MLPQSFRHYTFLSLSVKFTVFPARMKMLWGQNLAHYSYHTLLCRHSITACWMTDFRARQLQVGKYRLTSFITLYCTSQVLHFFINSTQDPPPAKRLQLALKRQSPVSVLWNPTCNVSELGLYFFAAMPWKSYPDLLSPISLLLDYLIPPFQ